MVLKKNIAYIGIKEPATVEEVNVEICGLKTVIMTAQEMIARLEQAVALMEMDKKKKQAEEQEPENELQSEGKLEEMRSETKDGS